jgi:hypothetical protein
VVSFNRTFNNGDVFGQMVPGVSLAGLVTESGGPTTQYLVGLSDDDERRGEFGVGNPNDGAAEFVARIYTRDPRVGPAQLLATTVPVKLAPFGLRHFRPAELRQKLGVEGETDYLVEIETRAGGPLVPYGTNTRNATKDPSFQLAGDTRHAEQFFVGVMAKPALNGSLWESTLVLFGPSKTETEVQLTFIRTGVAGRTNTVTVTLQPGETTRIEDVLDTKWGIRDSQGVLEIVSNGPSGSHPVALLELYDNSQPDKRYGQTMRARNLADASGPGEKQVLLGLASDAAYRSVLWFYAPEGKAVADLVYRDLTAEHKVLGTISNFTVMGGGTRAVAPSGHPLGSYKGRFTVEVLVKEGKLVSGAQTTNSLNNDPAFSDGQRAPK